MAIGSRASSNSGSNLPSRLRITETKQPDRGEPVVDRTPRRQQVRPPRPGVSWLAATNLWQPATRMSLLFAPGRDRAPVTHASGHRNPHPRALSRSRSALASSGFRPHPTRNASSSIQTWPELLARKPSCFARSVEESEWAHRRSSKARPSVSIGSSRPSLAIDASASITRGSFLTSPSEKAS